MSSGSACTSASLEPSYVLRALGVEEDMAHTSIRCVLSVRMYYHSTPVVHASPWTHSAASQRSAHSGVWRHVMGHPACCYCVFAVYLGTLISVWHCPPCPRTVTKGRPRVWLRRFGLGRFTTAEEVDRAVALTVGHVEKLREMSPLWEMVQEGIDIKSIQWSQH